MRARLPAKIDLETRLGGQIYSPNGGRFTVPPARAYFTVNAFRGPAPGPCLTDQSASSPRASWDCRPPRWDCKPPATGTVNLADEGEFADLLYRHMPRLSSNVYIHVYRSILALMSTKVQTGKCPISRITLLAMCEA